MHRRSLSPFSRYLDFGRDIRKAASFDLIASLRCKDLFLDLIRYSYASILFSCQQRKKIFHVYNVVAVKKSCLKMEKFGTLKVFQFSTRQPRQELLASSKLQIFQQRVARVDLLREGCEDQATNWTSWTRQWERTDSEPFKTISRGRVSTVSVPPPVETDVCQG